MSNTRKRSRNNEDKIQINGFEPILPKNYIQGEYLKAIHTSQLVFATGPAGTGKSFIAAAYAAELLYYKRVNKIILTRPAVEAGEKLGFLPGELDEKYAPYIAPFRETLDDLLGKSFVDYCLKTGYIEAAPLAFLRGRTFKDAVVILDEAQNTTITQMKLFLSRIGENSKIIINGDTSQKDITGKSGLEDAINRLKQVREVSTVQFHINDIVRSPLCKQIIQAYSED